MTVTTGSQVVCRCGQAFCWSCKEEIGVEGYRHYCQHFTMRTSFILSLDPFRLRELIKCCQRCTAGQSCQQCEKCLLYKEPDEKELVREAVQTGKLNASISSQPWIVSDWTCVVVFTARRKWMIEHPELVDQVGDGMAVSIDLTERNRGSSSSSRTSIE